MVTWQNTSYDTTRNAMSNDDFAFAMLVDSTIVNAGLVTNVQINFAGSAGSGTVHCCRWDDLATMNAETSAADLLAAANHTYWSKDATTISAGMTSETVTSSSANVSGNVIGFVLVGSASDTLSTRFNDSVISGYTTYKSNSGGTGSYTRTLTFTISTAGSATGGTRLPPPPLIARF